MRRFTLALSGLLLAGCAGSAALPAPPAYTEHLRHDATPSAYVRPPDELEQAATLEAPPAMEGHEHGGAPPAGDPTHDHAPGMGQP